MWTPNAAAAALIARQLAGELIPKVELLHLATPTPQRWAIAGAPLEWGGHTWAARDMLLGPVEADVSEHADLQITLPGVTDAERALAFADVDGAAVERYLAWVDPDTGEVADAMPWWSGELSVAGWQAGRESYVHLLAESRASLALRVQALRYTNDEQLRLYPGDTSLDFDPATDAAPVVWPAASFFRA